VFWSLLFFVLSAALIGRFNCKSFHLCMCHAMASCGSVLQRCTDSHRTMIYGPAVPDVQRLNCPARVM
jgi:hypothetical protein